MKKAISLSTVSLLLLFVVLLGQSNRLSAQSLTNLIYLPISSVDLGTPTVLLSGNLQDADATHQGSGTVTVNEYPNGQRYVRLENFMVTPGPGLDVMLSSNENPAMDGMGLDYVGLGDLVSADGTQAYLMPASVDLSQFKSVVIYCVPFHVVFSFAPMQ